MARVYLASFVLLSTHLSYAQEKEPGNDQDVPPFVIELQDQSQGRITRITLFVNASALFGKNALDLADVAMWDNHNPIPVPGKGLQSDVFRNALVFWTAEMDEQSRREGYSVSLIQADLNGDNCLFDQTVLAGNSGMVISKVKNVETVAKCETPYLLDFQIQDKNGNTRFYKLDPILKGNN